MNTSLHVTLTRVCFAVILFLSGGVAHADTFLPFDPAKPTNPYGLDDIDGFDFGDYNYCRWGVPQDQQSVGVLEATADLSFTHLTRGPFSFADNPDLFVSTSLTTLTDWNLLKFSEGTWTPPSGNNDGSVSFFAQSGKTYSLFRKLHFSDFLLAKSFFAPLPANAKKVIILIHGHNPESDPGHYYVFDDLYEALKAELAGTEWHLVLYDWAEDADNGVYLEPFKNPTESATIAHFHGQHLGELLSTFPQLEKVHFIAHSAGTWAARAATRHLLLRTTKQVQITLLDPFIPGMKEDHSTPLKRERIVEIPAFANGQSEKLVFLENIYADDRDGTGGWPFGSDNIYSATSQKFNWPAGKGWDQRVDWSPGGTPATSQADYYDTHAGPIAFYADTVLRFGSQNQSRAGLNNSDFNLDLAGWKKSMFMQEPVIRQQPTSPPPVAIGSSTGFQIEATTRLAESLGPIAGSVTVTWEKLTGTPSTGPPPTGAVFSINSVTAAHVGTYRAKVQSGTLVAYSNTVTLTVSGGTQTGTSPPAPTNLVATAVSSSQINLTWSHSGSNVAGFELQRRLATGTSWVPLPVVSATGRSFANVAGLSPDTAYSYRIRALNGGAQPSSWSAEAPARTFLAPASNVSVTVVAVDNSGTSVIALSVAISTWTGSAADFSTLTTAGASGFTRTLPVGVTAWFSAPPTLPDGRKFQKWLFGNGTTAAQDFFSIAKFNLTGATTAFAHYAFTAPPTRTLTALTIEGSSTVDENSSASYKARASYSDGGSGYVSANWDEDSSYADISSSGVLDTEAVSSDKSVEIEATYTSGGVTRTATKNVTIRNAASTQTYTLTRNVVGSGEIGYSPTGGNFAAGTVVSLHGNEGDGYVFSHWTGDASGTEDDITIRMDGNRSVTAHFVVDTSYGNLRVDISPPQAVAESAQWKYDNFTAWRDSGNTQTGISPRTNRNVFFKDIPGWITPANFKTSIIGGQTTVVSGAAATYREILGAVQVTITPAQAAQAGARWRLNGGAWRESGTTVADAPTGAGTIDFLAVAGWTTPPAQAITVARGLTTTRSGDYTPPAGFPIITSVAPRTGPIAGGTTVTFEGANFLPGATVTFGGVPATSVAVVSATRLTAVTPPRASYGTVPLVLTSGGQTVTQANGFSYLNALGSNIELVGQYGGHVFGVAVAGNLCYYGEGTTLVIADFTNSAAPVERGRITLPDVILNVTVSSNTAYVAIGNTGIYAVDVSSPTAPAIVGFFDTTGYAYSVQINAAKAYVADGNSGLQILDITDRAAIALAGSYVTAGRVERLAVGVIGGETYAFLSESNGPLRIVRVTSPSSPSEVATIAASGVNGTGDVKVVGTKLYVADRQLSVRVFDVSSPGTPVQVATADGPGFFGRISIEGNRIYACKYGGGLRVSDLSVVPAAQFLGDFSVDGNCDGLAVANGLAFVAMGQEGLKVISVSNPAAMSLRSKIDAFTAIERAVVSSSTVFVGKQDGLHTLDVSNPATPLFRGKLLGFRVSDIGLVNNSAVLVDYGSTTVRVANVANPAAPSISGTYSGTTAWELAVMNSTPVLSGVTTDTAKLPRLDTLNVSVPASPQSVGALTLDSVSSNGSPMEVAVGGTWAFVGRANPSPSSLYVVNIGNPSSPQKVATVTLPTYPNDVAATSDGGFVYVADNSGVRVYDMSNKSAPAFVTTLDTPQTPNTTARRVHIAGNRLYTAESGFLFVFDITSPASPQLIAYYDTPGGSSQGISVFGNLIYVAGYNEGVSILRLKDVDKPTILITSPTTNTTYSTTNALLTLGGTATDLQGVVRVTWENDRGGGGVALGTTSWSIANLQLAAGVNLLTVTVEDANGNRATDSLTVTATLPDTTAPVVTITGPKPEAQFSTEAATITLSGSAADNTQVAAVTWADALGNSGTASISGQTWSVGPIALFEGPNTIIVTALDAAGNSAFDSVVVLRTLPDATPPNVVIDFPTLKDSFSTESDEVNVSGTASDDGRLTWLEWSSDRGTSGSIHGLAVWSANAIPLQPGLNVITVTAYDASGNTQTDTLNVTYSLPPTVTPSAGAGGSISPNFPVSVNTGGGVAFIATPSTGHVVNQWLVNGVVRQTSGANYILSNVTANTTVQVTFKPLPLATTLAALIVTSNSAVLSGTVNPSGLLTTVHFEYGTTTSYGTATPNQALAAGTSTVPMQAILASLLANKTYHYRVVASNSNGTTSGLGQSFTTTSPGTDVATVGNWSERTVVRNLPTAVGSEVDIGTLTFTGGTGTIEAAVNASGSGWSVAKRYVIPIRYNLGNGSLPATWLKVLPTHETGPYGVNNFDLDVNVTGATAQLRLRTTGSSGIAATARIAIKTFGLKTFANSSATAGVPVAPTQTVGGNAVDELIGKTGIGVAPAGNAVLDVNGGDTRGVRLRVRTTAGPPTTGTWSMGTMILDKDGNLYICTAASPIGTPAGTWKKVGN